MNCILHCFEDLIKEKIDIKVNPCKRLGYVFEEFYPLLLNKGYAPVLFHVITTTRDYPIEHFDSFPFIKGELERGIRGVLGVRLLGSGKYHAIIAFKNSDKVILQDRLMRYDWRDIVVLDAVLLYPTRTKPNKVHGIWKGDDENEDIDTNGVSRPC